MKPLIIIPARGGSKGVPRKNIKLLNNKPLIYYTIDAARSVAPDCDICVTTDDNEIIDIVEKYGLKVPFKRPEKLANDTASGSDVLLHAVQFYKEKLNEYDCVILLQPTSPFRTGKQVKEAIQLFTNKLDMIVSVNRTKSNPYYVLFEENQEGYLEPSKKGNFTTRQACPDVWEYNGAIYVINIDRLLELNGMGNFKKIKKYVMPAKSSVDIDTPEDWEYAEFLMQKNNL